jgi:hypothetical protein
LVLAVVSIGRASAAGPVWSELLGSPVDEYGYGVAADSSGNVFLTGYTLGNLVVANGGGKDVFALKLDGSGKRIWGGQLQDTGDSFGRAVAVDPSGNVYVAGSTTDALWTSYNGGLDDGFLARWDAATTGAERWSQPIGTSGDDLAFAVATDQSGNVYVAGTTSGAFPGQTNHGGYDLFLAKFDSGGNRLWVTQQGSFGDDSAQALAIDQSGNPILAGTTTGNLFGTNAGGKDLFLLKTDPSGHVLWSTQRGTTGDDVANAIAVDPTGLIYVAGSTTGSLGFNYTNTGGLDAFVLQYTASGSVGWSRQLGTNTDDEAFGVATDTSGNIYLGGYTTGALAGPSAGGYDALVVQYDRNGNQVWASQLGGAGAEIARGVAVSGAGTLYVVGGTTGSFGGSTNSGGRDVFVAKYGVGSGGGPSYSWSGNPSNPGTYLVTFSAGPNAGKQQQAYSYSVGGWTTVKYDGAEEASADGIALGSFQGRVGYQFKRNQDGTQTPTSSYYSDPMGANPAPGGVTWGTGDTATIAFSLFLPSSTFPIGSPSNPTGFGYGFNEWALLQQFHSLSQPGGTVGGVLFTATRSDSQGGILYVNKPNCTDANQNACVLWSHPLPDSLDKWWDFAMVVTFGQNGRLVLYVNGIQQADYSGPIYDPAVPNVRWNVTQDLYRKADLPTATIDVTPIVVPNGAPGASQ